MERVDERRMIIIMAAVSKNGVIGDSKTGNMPWHVSSELKFFKRETLGKIVVMGRKTAESVGNLPERHCLVLSSRDDVSGYKRVSVDDVLFLDDILPFNGIMICGGRKTYETFMPHAKKMMISRLPFDADGDVLFPEPKSEDWEIESTLSFSEFEVEIYKRVTSPALLCQNK